MEKQKEQRKIVKILCPNCRKNFMEKTVNRFGQGIKWICRDCVYVWPEDWFDIFHQFEECVERE